MLRFALLAVLCLGFVAPVAAEYPERALTIVVAYPAGGMVDIVARPMADSMKKTFTKGVAVLNRPGGGGSVGMAEVAQAKPDGYTVIIAPNSTLVIHPQINELPYKTPDDYEPILNTITFYTLLTVKADAPWKTVQEFMAAAKANPGQLRGEDAAPGALPHARQRRRSRGAPAVGHDPDPRHRRALRAAARTASARDTLGEAGRPWWGHRFWVRLTYKAAKALGLTIPQALLPRAGRVIE